MKTLGSDAIEPREKAPINVYLHLCAAPEDERFADEVEKHLVGALDPKLGVRVTREKQIEAGMETAEHACGRNTHLRV